MTKPIPWVCPGCGAERMAYLFNIKRSCNGGMCRKCAHRKGADHPMFKSGEVTTIDGRVCVLVAAGVYKLRYRQVMEQHLGRELQVDEHVHHINGDKMDDRVENLRLMTASEHRYLHMWEERGADGPDPRTHCKRGHEYTDANTLRSPKTGARSCRVCMRARDRKRDRRRERMERMA